jgi:hypothetical protein
MDNEEDGFRVIEPEERNRGAQMERIEGSVSRSDWVTFCVLMPLLEVIGRRGRELATAKFDAPRHISPMVSAGCMRS